MGPIPISFDSHSLFLLNIILALMMFGVSLTLRVEDFQRVVTSPRPTLVGVGAQFLLLPALSCLLTWGFRVEPELALGMMLVAACPSGSFSNIMTFLARGNVALSVSMTAICSLLALILTPFNFWFYGSLNPYTRPLLQDNNVEAGQIIGFVLLVLVLPLLLGMLAGRWRPALARRLEKPLRPLSLIIFLAFVALAFAKNIDLFVRYMPIFAGLVIVQNLLALLTGYVAATLMRLEEGDRRAVTIEVGIQNSGLALAILFTFYPQAGGMMLIAAFWGVWHLVSGSLLAFLWSRQPFPKSAP
ncbi:MAG: bile acid:sodium symporter family protein [Moraxellaceae bacterium]|nr:bile acid:sodium symporter family protein [Moraxellaceae bacterium]